MTREQHERAIVRTHRIVRDAETRMALAYQARREAIAAAALDPNPASKLSAAAIGRLTETSRQRIGGIIREAKDDRLIA